MTRLGQLKKESDLKEDAIFGSQWSLYWTAFAPSVMHLSFGLLFSVDPAYISIV